MSAGPGAWLSCGINKHGQYTCHCSVCRCMVTPKMFNILRHARSNRHRSAVAASKVAKEMVASDLPVDLFRQLLDAFQLGQAASNGYQLEAGIAGAVTPSKPGLSSGRIFAPGMCRRHQLAPLPKLGGLG